MLFAPVDCERVLFPKAFTQFGPYVLDDSRANVRYFEIINVPQNGALLSLDDVVGDAFIVPIESEAEDIDEKLFHFFPKQEGSM